MKIGKWKLAALKLMALAMMMAAAYPASAIPAFARKYGLPCSACHEAWPKLNTFGQNFRDNGYQLGNDRDSPVYQQPAYFPITFRVTPAWQRLSNSNKAVDSVPGDHTSGLVEKEVTTSGFNFSGIDVVTAGTLYKNISFMVQPFFSDGGTSFQQVFVRFDNLLHSPWLNVKFGKFELDTLISQQRVLPLDSIGSSYQNYFFSPPGDNNVFGGIGNNPFGVELMGHSDNSYRRYSIALLGSSNGPGGVPASQSVNVYANFDQGFDIRKIGTQRVGGFAYIGQSPTYFQTTNGSTVPGTGTGTRSFYRAGLYGVWEVGKFDFSTFYEHGSDNVFLGNAVPSNQPSKLPVGAAGPSWNGGFVETHYIYNPKLILIGRYELIRMAQQANPTIPHNLGNLNAWTVGYRWYPFMSTRAGLAWVQEYSRVNNIASAPLSGMNDVQSSYLMGFDFDF
jgi:hypothetical protein